MTHHRLLRSSSTTTTGIISTNYISSTSFIIDPDHKPLVGTSSTAGFARRFSRTIHSILNVISIPTILPSCRWLSLPTQLSLRPSHSRKVTGTLFGNRRGHVSFAVQYDPRSEPVLVVELAVSTAALVKEMSSGLVRIALECEKQHRRGNTKLFHEPTWSMYCNGRKCGYAQSRACSESDWHVLSTVQSVSVGAGVIPVVEDSGKRKGEGELLYMRARFERVVGSRDSEAFYMMNPDGNF
ncbi:Protein of unknown function DUF617, plant [Cynara cardunculus var. scolymus]|uniref:Uncharacterized protein n=1 Tax=Cynara cardunculus var. scolymus TaxID=59895 RepID=A0A103YN22_CYNCS|nr:Protein of unknown function DUF617, plant [Cynara cardunculus var. scolymus]